MKPIKHAVWSTPAPQGPTGYWEQADYIIFEDAYRPHGYTGDRYDQVAWNNYLETRRKHLKAEFMRSTSND